MKLLLMVLLLSSTLRAEEFVIAYSPVKAAPPVEVVSADKAFLRSTARFKRSYHKDGYLVTGHGTAFGVDLSAFGYVGKQYLLTAWHNTVDDADPDPLLQVEISGTWVACKVLACDKETDICLLESSVAMSDVITLDNAELALNDPLVLCGSPRGVPIGLFIGSLKERFVRGSYKMLAEIPFDHGDSGGPVVSQKTYKLIGMAVSGVPKNGDINTQFMLYMPLSVIASFLQDNRRP